MLINYILWIASVFLIVLIIRKVKSNATEINFEKIRVNGQISNEEIKEIVEEMRVKLLNDDGIELDEVMERLLIKYLKGKMSEDEYLQLMALRTAINQGDYDE